MPPPPRGRAAIIIWQLVAQHTEKHVVAWSIAAIFVAVAVPISIHDIHMHTMHVSHTHIPEAFHHLL
jgi:hypothetical protein